MREAPVKVGERRELTADSLVAGGEAICRVDGFPIFVPGIYPGDRAEVLVTEVKRGFGRGRSESLLAKSGLRRTSSCRVAETCGGCDWTELRLDAQLEAKRSILFDSLRRIGRLDLATLPEVVLHASPLNYRLRSRLHVDPVTGEVGFFGPKSHNVVPLPGDCEVVGPRLLSIVDQIRVDDDYSQLDAFELENDVVIVPHNGEEGRLGAEVSVGVGGYTYNLSTSSFFQVNRHLLPTLIRLVEESASRSTPRTLAFDIYGGVGFFAAPLAKIFDEVVSVESSEESSGFAQQNTAGLEGVRVVASRAEEFLQDVEETPDFVLVDPPRAGLSVGVRRQLATIRPKRIAYLSCDPVTFSRDVAELVGHGWVVHTLDLLDLFPNTHHVETLASLVIDD